MFILLHDSFDCYINYCLFQRHVLTLPRPKKSDLFLQDGRQFKGMWKDAKIHGCEEHELGHMFVMFFAFPCVLVWVLWLCLIKESSKKSFVCM